jgi:hypothetical protein
MKQFWNVRVIQWVVVSVDTMRTESSGTGFLILYIYKGRYLLQTCVCIPVLVWNIVYNKSYGFLEVECLSVVLRSIRLFAVWHLCESFQSTLVWLMNQSWWSTTLADLHTLKLYPQWFHMKFVVYHLEVDRMCMALLHFGCCNLCVAQS